MRGFPSVGGRPRSRAGATVEAAEARRGPLLFVLAHNVPFSRGSGAVGTSFPCPFDPAPVAADPRQRLTADTESYKDVEHPHRPRHGELTRSGDRSATAAAPPGGDLRLPTSGALSR